MIFSLRRNGFPTIAVALCLTATLAYAGEKTPAQVSFEKAIGWFSLSEACQNSDITLAPSSIHRSMALDISNIYEVPYQQAETVADHAFNDYKKIIMNADTAKLKRMRNFDNGSMVQMRVCAEAGFSAQQEFRQSLRDAQKSK